MKKRLDIRIAEELRDGIDVIIARDQHTLTSVVERYVRDGLARDNGELIEQNSLPEVRKAVREEVGKSIQELYQQLSTDLAKSAKRSDDRLAALAVKAARFAGVAQRMIYSLLAKNVSPEFAARSYEAAKELTGKDIAKPDEATKPSDERK